MSGPTIEWSLLSYGAFDLQGLERWLALRQQVFVVEQQCPYPDIDGRDIDALHLLGYVDGATAGSLVAGARLFAPDSDHPFSRIGRVVVAPACRGYGLGRVLMQRAMAECVERWPSTPIRLSAQAHLREFYGSLGFMAIGDIYDEDGIPHIDMQCDKPLS